jgi:hypothetical protein
MSDDFQKTGQGLLVEVRAHRQQTEVSGRALAVCRERLTARDLDDAATVLSLGELGKVHQRLDVEIKNRVALMDKLEDFARRKNFEQQPALLAEISTLRQKNSTLRQGIIAAEISRAAALHELEERARDTGGPGPQHPALPNGACFLLDLLLPRSDRDAIPGDLEEDFGSDLSKYGAGYARLRFWTRTLVVIAWRNPLCRWVLVTGLARVADWLLRKLG